MKNRSALLQTAVEDTYQHVADLLEAGFLPHEIASTLQAVANSMWREILPDPTARRDVMIASIESSLADSGARLN